MARVLLIYDEPDLLEMCDLVLQSGGHTAVRAFTEFDRGLDLDALSDPVPDVVVLDLVMPHVTGEEVFRRLRDAPVTSKVPVVIMSALAEGEQIAKDLGADGFLEKPFDADELLDTVDQVLGSGSG